MYRFEIKKIDIESLTSFSVGNWFRNAKAENIPKQSSSFDFALEYIIRELQVLKFYKYYIWPLIPHDF